MSELADLKLPELLSAALVIAVPTGATIFAEAVQDWPVGGRWALMVLWLVAAGFLVFDQAKRNQRSDSSFAALDSLTDETRVRLSRQAEDAQSATFESFLKPDLWFPRKWSWTVYLYDQESQLLAPIWPSSENKTSKDLISFSPGYGATGQAWMKEKTIVRIGSEVHDGTHGLTPEQQKHFKGKNSVVATPIWSDEEKIGVLSGITDDEDQKFDAQTDRSHLERTATILATLLVTLKTED